MDSHSALEVNRSAPTGHSMAGSPVTTTDVAGRASTYTPLDLSSVRELRLEPGMKGFPNGLVSMNLGEAAAQGWSLSDLQLPAAVLRRSALENNARWMSAFADGFGVGLCPHGKTTMAPQLFDRQLRDGAWGITCATLAHLKLYRRFGIRRVIFANQICSADAADWVAQALGADPGFDLLIFVDSIEGASLLADAARRAELARPIQVLIEVGAAGIRTGVRGVEQALALAGVIGEQRPWLALVGCSTFEGVIPGRTDEEIEAGVEALLEDSLQFIELAGERGLFSDLRPPVLTAGGSKYYDLVALRLKAARLPVPFEVVIRSGCYLTNDADEYASAHRRMRLRSPEVAIPGGLRNALEVWADVQSRPEPGLMFANAGKRDLSFDHGLPRIISVPIASGVAAETLTLQRLSDQHAHITVPEEARFSVGDRLAFGVSHPCTTFDKWRVLFELDDEDRVVDLIATFF